MAADSILAASAASESHRPYAQQKQKDTAKAVSSQAFLFFICVYIHSGFSQ